MPAQPNNQVDDATAALVTSFTGVADIASWTLSGSVALARTRALLQLSEQLTAVIAEAVGDVQARELFALDDAGSVRGWLRTQPCGEGQHTARARQLARHPVVDAALRSGVLSAGTAGIVCVQLDRIPDTVPDDQLWGLLVHGVPGLLSSWTGGLVLQAAVTDQLIARREEAAAVLRGCAEDVTAASAVRLEPVFVLLGRTVTPAHLSSSLQALVDALLPEQLADQEQDSHDETYLQIRRCLTGGWDLRGHLDDTVGQTLIDQLDATLTALLRGLQPETEPELHDQLPVADVVVLHPTVQDPTVQDPTVQDPTADGTALPGCVLRSRKQNLYDAFVALLLDAAAGLGLGQPRPAHLRVITTRPALHGQPGALPGTLESARGPINLPADTVRRLGCHSTLTAVLLDATGNPIGASGTHRNATTRERRALRAQWGPTCAISGCPTTTTVPHHVEPWWLSHHTQLKDLLPICAVHHHDIHEGHRTLRIRDGRNITPTGWESNAAAA